MQEEMVRLVEEIEGLVARKRGGEQSLRERAERAEKEVVVLREEVESLRMQIREMLEKADAGKKREDEAKRDDQKKRATEDSKKKQQDQDEEEERKRKRAAEEERSKNKREEEEEKSKKKREVEDKIRADEEKNRVDEERKRVEEEKKRVEEEKKRVEEEKKRNERSAEHKRAEEEDGRKREEEKKKEEMLDQEKRKAASVAAVSAVEEKQSESDHSLPAKSEPSLPARRKKNARPAASVSAAAGGEHGDEAALALEEASPACVRAMLLAASEKLRGDSDLKSDMPLTTVPAPRLLLLLRSGILLGQPNLCRFCFVPECLNNKKLGKTVARLYPGRFDPLCLRSKGGESNWQQNLEKVWQACSSSVLPSSLLPLVLDGVNAACLVALQLVLRDAHAIRARQACKQWLNPGQSDSWPLSAVLRVWSLGWAQAEGAGPLPEWGRPDEVPRPAAGQLAEALCNSGACERRSGDAGKPSLAESLRGGPMEGLVVAADEELPDDAVEILLLWAAAKISQKSKLRSSVIKAAGSDTSWIDRSSKKK
jgi:hypothetical protein